MAKYGLTAERYAQMSADYDDRRIKEIVHDWGADQVNKGYIVVDYDGTGMLEIERIDEVGAFDSDEEAVDQALADGVRLIPVAELPERFPFNWLGWIDTPENRQAIEDYMERMVRR